MSSGSASPASSSSSEDEAPPPPPPLAPNRSRRSNAGNWMSKMMTDYEKMEGDEVYETLYGGFLETENDMNFEVSKAEAKAADNDSNSELDDQSDDDEGEGDDDTTAAEEDEAAADGAPRKKKAPKGSWILSKMAETTVKENQLSKEEQNQRMAECVSVAKQNTRSLAELKRRQLEEQEKNATKPRARHVVGSKESWFSDKNQTYVLLPEVKKWKSPEQVSSPLKCAITGAPAKYVDPLTKLPYRGIAEFKELRQQYSDGLLDEPMEL